MDNDKSIKTLTRSKLRPFRYHPYKVKEDEDMANLVNSIKEEGVISPIIVRKVGKNLEKINEKYIYQNTCFENKLIKYTMLGKKKELFLRNCKIEATSLSSLDIKERIVFHNCIFDNVKISKCNFKNVVFYNCRFNNSIIVNSILANSYFINCKGIETVDFMENNMQGVSVIGSKVNLNELVEKQNRFEDILIQEEMLEVQHGNVAVLEEKKEDDQEMKEENERQIIKNEIYSCQELSQDFLNNKLFYKCHFVDCSVSDNVKLNATTDFKECTFLNNALHFDDVDKTSFDDCIFEKVSLKGNFIHVSFVGSKFSNLSFIRDSTFVACLFDHTNAAEYFDNNLIKLSNIELVKKSNDNTEILKKVNELYEILKSEDKVLQQELIAKTKVDEEDVLDYILHLDDMEYLKLIAKTSNRVVEEKMV